MFAIFVGLTLVITYWAASRTKTASDFYTAGGGITGFQNGLAMAGDYMSAAALLGLTALVFTNCYDGYVFSITDKSARAGKRARGLRRLVGSRPDRLRRGWSGLGFP